MQKGANPGNVQLGSRSEAIPAVLAGGPDFDQGNDGDADKIIASAIPETSTWAMMPLGSIGLGSPAIAAIIAWASVSDCCPD